NNSIFSDIDEHLLDSNQEYPLSNNQEITLSEIVEQANNTLTILDIIDLTKLSLETDS
ncbi:6766_t:CDS:1, partial [Racocetra persica]